MFRLAELRCVSAEGTARLQQVAGVEGAATGITLVAPGARVCAVGTVALDVAVGQEPDALAAIGQKHVVGVNVALVVQRLENVVGYGLVVLGVGVSEQVE